MAKVIYEEMVFKYCPVFGLVYYFQPKRYKAVNRSERRKNKLKNERPNFI